MSNESLFLTRAAQKPRRTGKTTVGVRPPCRGEGSRGFLVIIIHYEAFMVYLSKIYTKTGDQGTTGLGDGQRVSKAHPRVVAYGEVDELNSVLGLVLAQAPAFAEASLLREIQNDLFDVGADLCVPPSDTETEGQALRVTMAQVEKLERHIDRLNERLQPLRSFILPGGSLASAWLHLARTVCRRAERATVSLFEQSPRSSTALIYLNRLSDLLFVLARVANRDGADDVLWVPGQHRHG